jgi:hypothetical protein
VANLQGLWNVNGPLGTGIVETVEALILPLQQFMKGTNDAAGCWRMSLLTRVEFTAQLFYFIANALSLRTVTGTGRSGGTHVDSRWQW